MMTIEDLFYCALAWSKTCLFFYQQFLSLDLESVKNNSERDLALLLGRLIRLMVQ